MGSNLGMGSLHDGTFSHISRQSHPTAKPALLRCSQLAGHSYWHPMLWVSV